MAFVSSHSVCMEQDWAPGVSNQHAHNEGQYPELGSSEVLDGLLMTTIVRS